MSGAQANVPCLTAASAASRNFHACDSNLSFPSGAPNALILDDGISGTSGSGILSTALSSTSNSLFAQTYVMQRGSRGAQTLWLVDGSTTPTTIPGTTHSGGYGDASGGIPNAILGVTFDAAGGAASTNGASCPSVGWSSALSKANQIVVRGGSDATGNGFCFIASTNQPFNSVATTSSVGSLTSSSASDGWQRYVVAIIPPSVTHSSAVLEVSVDAGSGSLSTVLAIRLPGWAWSPTTIASTAHWGFSGVGNGTINELHEWTAAQSIPPSTAPSTPQNVGVQWSTPTNGKVSATVSFTPSLSDGGSPITSYAVSAAGRSCTVTSGLSGAMSCTLDSLPVARTIAFSVVAMNSLGVSTPAITHSSSSTMSQQISFSVPSSVTYSPAGLVLQGTSTSSLPVSYSATGSCGVTAGTLTYTSLGQCTVTATQPGSTVYAGATPVSVTTTVTAATATLSASDLSVPVDSNPHPVSVTVTPPVSGVVEQYCVAQLGAAPACSSTAPSTLGQYVVNVSLKNPFYVASPIAAQLTLIPAVSILPPDLGGSSTPVTTNGASLSIESQTMPSGIDAQATLSGFSSTDSVVLSVIGDETLGTFTVPSSASSLSGLLQGSTSATTVGSPVSVTASKPSDLSYGGTVAFPNGSFTGGGSYFVIPVTTSGLVPGTLVSAIAHSTPTVLATAQVSSSGQATVYVPLPQSWAGQSHQLFLNGTYQSTTVAAGSGSTATVHISNSLLSRLAPGSTTVISGTSVTNPSVYSTNFVSLPATSTTTSAPPVVIGGGVPLVTYSPTAHPAETQKQVTRVVAAVAVVAAAAGAAAAAGSAAGAGATSGGSSGSGSGGGGNGPESTVGVQANFDLAAEERQHLGDQSRIWRLVGHQTIDRLSREWAHLIGRVSPLLSSSMADANYLRAIFGGLYSVLPVAGLALGVTASISMHEWAYPPSLSLFLAILVLGFMDSFSGFVAAAAFVTIATVSGHITNLNSIVLAAVIGGIWFGLPLMVKSMRPFVRPHPHGFDQWWQRGSDAVILVLFSGFLSYSLVGSLSSAAHAQLDVSTHAAMIAFVVMGVAAVRFALVLGVSLWFPKRLATVTMPKVAPQHPVANWTMFAGQTAFVALLMYSFVGATWTLVPLVAIPTATALVGELLVAHLPSSTWFYRLVPRATVNTLFMSIVGALVGRLLAHNVTSAFWLVTGQILIMMGVVLLYNIAAGIGGEGWAPSWKQRIAGMGLFALTVLQVTGHLVK